MKSLDTIKSIFYMVLVLLGIGCAGSAALNSNHGARSNEVIPTEDQNSPSDWPTLLRSVPGLKVTGSYPNISLQIRGAKSLSQTSEPLYVLDGTPLGRSFSALAGATDPLQVEKVRVLKGAEASRYGMRGTNGVIEVTTKN